MRKKTQKKKISMENAKNKRTSKKTNKIIKKDGAYQICRFCEQHAKSVDCLVSDRGIDKTGQCIS